MCQCGIHRRHIDRSGRQRVGRLVDPLTLAVEAEGESTRLETVWVTPGQKDSSLSANDFEGEWCIRWSVTGDFDGQSAAAAHARLYQQVIGCGALDLLAGVGERDCRMLQGGEGIEALDCADYQDRQVQRVTTQDRDQVRAVFNLVEIGMCRRQVRRETRGAGEDPGGQRSADRTGGDQVSRATSGRVHMRL